jgi:hypothetical protein
MSNTYKRKNEKNEVKQKARAEIKKRWKGFHCSP